jgi:hypothetical protein
MADDEARRVQHEQATNFLNSFLVNGQPIGDCTVTEVEVAAQSKEREARFMRLMISGLPPVGIVRKYRTEEEAAALWAQANGDVTSRAAPARRGGINPGRSSVHAPCTL